MMWKVLITKSLSVLEWAGCDKDIDPGVERSKRPLSPKFHLYIDQEIPRTLHLSMQVHSARVGVQLAGAEVVLLISLRDGDDDVVSGVGGGRSDAKDLRRDDDVGLEAEVVVGDSQRRVLTLEVIGAGDPFAATVGGTWEGKDFYY